MKKALLSLVIILCFNLTFSQNTQLEKANEFIDVRGELTLRFKVNNPSEIQRFANQMSIESFDRQTKTVTAWVNTEQFNNFLALNIPFEVFEEDNVYGERLMSNQLIPENQVQNTLSGPLTFPLTAYPTYQDYADQMASFASENPSICQLIDIGGTEEGIAGGDKRLLFIKLSDNVTSREAEPRVMYTSSMHGDELTGFAMTLNLIDYFITAYNDGGHPDHSRVQNLINNSEVWINPLANPDGTYYNDSSNTSVAFARRGNANNLDLNRNYPDPSGVLHPDGQPYQIETLNFMALAESTQFVIAANFHGGAEVVNYPWDYTYDRHPDDDWWILISSEYADNAKADGAINGFPNYFTSITSSGITHGADWYLVNGGRQDYMNFYTQAKEVTIEVSDTKKPSASLLDDYWFSNKEAMIDYLIQGTYGFRGVVKDATTGNPIEAKISLVGHDDLGSWATTELPLGDYYRPVKAGTYDILFEADCYESFTLNNQTISDFQTITLPEVQLTPIAATAPSGLAVSNVQASSATLSWDTVNGASYDYRYRTVGSSTWTTSSTGNALVNLSNLAIGTQYEAQVRSNCNSSTSPYSTSIFFTTSNTVTISASYFEIGMDDWVEGRNDCSRTATSYSYEGSYSVRLRDGTGTSSAMTSQTFDLSSYGEVEISFYYYSNGMENGDDFWLRYNNGSSWSTLATYTSGTDFNDNSFSSATFTLTDTQYNLASNAQFRIQCDANRKNDQVYIDQVIITGTLSGPDVTPPSVPTNLIASGTTQTTTILSWNASTDNIGVTGYDVYQDGSFIVNVNSTNYQVSGLNPSTGYSFYVTARDAAGNTSGASNTVNVTTLDPPDTEDPTAPTNLMANNTTSFTADLSWSASTDNVGVTGYDIYQDGGFIANVAGTTYNVTGLNPSTSYAFYVIARDAAGNSSLQSNTVNVTTEAFVDTEAPTAPTGLSASNTTETTTDLSWNASSDNVGVTGYDIYQDGGFIANVSGTSYQVSGLGASTSYAFYVIARDAAGNSSTASSTINETTLAAPTCNDGIQNGDETGIDCGGSFCPVCPPSDTVLNQGYFETGLDGWIEGGNDCSRTSTSYSYEGFYSMRLRDATSANSTMTLSGINTSPYTQVEVDFYFYVNGMNNGEGLLFGYYNGNSWTTVQSYIIGSGISNDVFYNATVTLSSTQYTLASNAGFRFQSAASKKNEQVYVDQITITGLSGAAARNSGDILREIDSITTSIENEIMLHPNPIKNNLLNVELLQDAETITSFEIVNTVGQTVLSGKSIEQPIQIGTLETGLYIIKVNTGIKVLTKRFVKL